MSNTIQQPSLLKPAPSASQLPGHGVAIPKILAPVGGWSQFYAALNAGADAVFLGLKQFNARSRAENFTLQDLKQLVPIAHRYDMQVLITVNVLVKQSELSELLQLLQGLSECKVDAIIVQDLGVAHIARTYFPSLRLHASTQMAIHNLSGVRQAAAWGFKRVVIAREITAIEVKRMTEKLREEAIDVELEAFCHGSLCYSYSGLCFFSGAADGRSGNRGECAYTCREPYKIVSEPGHGFLFSMKDLDIASQLDKLVTSGVHTLKIEGRKKDAQYVAQVVRLYRNRLDHLFGKSTRRESAPVSPVDNYGAANGHKEDEASIRRDLSFTFQRKPTSFFIDGRYKENVIDLDSPAHAGLLVGKIKRVVDNKLMVELEQDIKRFDGLIIRENHEIFHAQPQLQPQHKDHLAHKDNLNPLELDASKLDVRYQGKEIQFSVRNMSVKGRWIHEASRGQVVELDTCDFSSSVHVDPKTLVGQRLFKVRSVDVKNATEKLIAPPPSSQFRVNPSLPTVALSSEPASFLSPAQFERWSLEAFLDVSMMHDDPEKLVFEWDVHLEGEPLCQEAFTLVHAGQRRVGSLDDDVESVFSVMGEIHAEVEISIAGESGWFVPKSLLKDQKRRLQKVIETTLAFRQQNALKSAKDSFAAIKDSVLAPAKSLIASKEAPAKWSVKLDRLSSLNNLSEILGSLRPTQLTEIVFEYKKHFQGSESIETIMEALVKFRDQEKVTVRLGMPLVIRAWDEPLLKIWCKKALSYGLVDFEISGVGQDQLLREWGISPKSLTTDFSLYALNHSAARFLQSSFPGLEKITMSIEDDQSGYEELLGTWSESLPKPQVILFKDTPLFIAEACTLTALHNGCPTGKVCGYRDLEIENKDGERFIVSHEGCKSIVYGKKAYSLSGLRHLFESRGVADFRIDFLTRNYTLQDMQQVMSSVFADLPIESTHTANFHSKLK